MDIITNIELSVNLERDIDTGQSIYNNNTLITTTDWSDTSTHLY